MSRFLSSAGSCLETLSGPDALPPATSDEAEEGVPLLLCIAIRRRHAAEITEVVPLTAPRPHRPQLRHRQDGEALPVPRLSRHEWSRLQHFPGMLIHSNQGNLWRGWRRSMAESRLAGAGTASSVSPSHRYGGRGRCT